MGKEYSVDAQTTLETRYLNLVADKSVGNATLVAGTVDVLNTAVTANSYVILTRKTGGGTQGNLSYTLTAGTKFTITSVSNTDTSTITWVLINPAADDN